MNAKQWNAFNFMFVYRVLKYNCAPLWEQTVLSQHWAMKYLYLNEYLLGSTIHGFRYLSATERVYTRIFWALVVIIQFSLVILFMNTFLKDWSDNQVVCINKIISSKYRNLRFYFLPYQRISNLKINCQTH